MVLAPNRRAKFELTLPEPRSSSVSSPQSGGQPPAVSKPPKKSPKKPPASKPASAKQRHASTPLVILGFVADGAAVLGLIVGRFDAMVAVAALLGAVGGLGILIKRHKVHIDRTNWLAIIGVVIGAVVLTIMVPQLTAENPPQSSAGATSPPAPTISSATSAPTGTGVTSGASTPSSAPAPTSAANSSSPKQLYGKSFTLKLSQGIDFEKDGAISSDLTGPDDDIDLFLGNEYGVLTLHPNAFHNKLVANTSTRVETAEHCAIEFKQGQPVSSTYVIASLSYCFETSDGHIGLLTVNQALPDAAGVKAVVWDAKLPKN